MKHHFCLHSKEKWTTTSKKNSVRKYSIATDFPTIIFSCQLIHAAGKKKNEKKKKKEKKKDQRTKSKQTLWIEMVTKKNCSFWTGLLEHESHFLLYRPVYSAIRRKYIAAFTDVLPCVSSYRWVHCDLFYFIYSCF